MQRQIIRPQLDQPLLVKLDFGPDGVEKRSSINNELQYMYTVNDDAGLIYLPANARQQLLRTGAQAGDSVEIVKMKNGWDIRVVSDTEEQPQQQQRAAARGNAYRQPAAPQSRSAQPTAQAQPPRPAANGVHPVGQQLAGCLRAAIDAATEAEGYAKGKNFPLEFTSEDIRAMAVSVFIGQQRNGGGQS
jgi:hypothetical protein